MVEKRSDMKFVCGDMYCLAQKYSMFAYYICLHIIWSTQNEQFIIVYAQCVRMKVCNKENVGF